MQEAEIIFIIMGLVELSKRFVKLWKLPDWILLLESFMLGLALGMSYQVSIAMPETFADWFAIAVKGIAYGLIASGVNDWVKAVAGKVSAPAIVAPTVAENVPPVDAKG